MSEQTISSIAAIVIVVDDKDVITHPGKWKVRALYAASPASLPAAEPTEEMWGGLARDIMMWLDFGDKHTPRSLFKHLENAGREIPQWLRDEPEMQNLDHVPSKGTRCVIIYKAMTAAAPPVASLPTPARPKLRAAYELLVKMADEYELEADEGTYTPNDQERMLLEDFCAGVFEEDELIELLRVAFSVPAPALRSAPADALRSTLQAKARECRRFAKGCNWEHAATTYIEWAEWLESIISPGAALSESVASSGAQATAPSSGSSIDKLPRC